MRDQRAGLGWVAAGLAFGLLSFVLGVLAALPAIGIGIYLIVRRRPLPGVTAIVLPFFAATFWIGIVGAGSHRVPSEAMVPTLLVGDRVMTSRASSAERGDIVVFEAPANAEAETCAGRRPAGSVCAQPATSGSDLKFVQRVVGLPGERIKIVDNRVLINGRRLDEPYVARGSPCEDLCNLPREAEIPEGTLFVMGDNRGESLDSRAWGPVPEEALLSRVRLRYWPPGSFGAP